MTRNKRYFHEPLGKIDHYPEIDKFIPEAELYANQKYPTNTISNYNELWSTCFARRMNKILIEKGLRV